ncbi:hypothetical protein [Vibrio diabolicus]|uniref:hypothetical protein n=1 Tax=Vibrio diabolicus TaxID=50719 RepID=UPI001785466D|nr:hypothetical protein [Vibrio diabolicus]
MKNVTLLFVLIFPMLANAELQCPPNSSPDYFGKNCYCDTGFEVKNNQCSKIEVPENATISMLGGWQCNMGYKKTGDKCTKVKVPENATLTYGGSWSCNTGYRKVGNGCDKVQLPENAQFTYGGSWSCNKGYKKNNNKCDKVKLPKNAHFTFGSTWQCDSGFKQTGNSCVSMTNSELIQQVNLLNRMLMMQIAKSGGGDCTAAFRACEDECDDQFSSYRDEDMCVEACEEGKRACE